MPPKNFKINASDITTYDYFGCSVSISGNYIVVGAKGNDDNGSSSGSAYLYSNESASIIENTDNTFSVYPNPFSEMLIIETEGNKQSLYFEIYNSINQLVTSGNTADKTIFQTKNLCPGIYFIKVKNENGYISKKIVKQ